MGERLVGLDHDRLGEPAEPAGRQDPVAHAPGVDALAHRVDRPRHLGARHVGHGGLNW